ncbi:MAG: PspC domain-containing protein [Endomicrobiales bacterium]|nr:PspC domain-containing protein [Endomicrobiales bacterium]
MKRFYRSQKDKKIAGICGGIGEILNVDPTLVRLGVVFVSLATAVMPAVLVYLLAWLIVPNEPDGGIR